MRITAARLFRSSSSSCGTRVLRVLLTPASLVSSFLQDMCRCSSRLWLPPTAGTLLLLVTALLSSTPRQLQLLLLLLKVPSPSCCCLSGR